MKYLSACSGIEAATQAWHQLGWTPVAFSEIEPFPSAVLAYHYPNVPNWSDMTRFKEWPNEQIDLLVGGTPCQSFSVAGLRAGLDDPRGNLSLTYCAIADRYRPRWLVWENVPGVLSIDKGRAFGSILGAMAELGYGWAYRILDAQYVRTRRFPRAVPQRRRRVFVVGYLGDWRRAAAVLFDAESLRGNPPPDRGSMEESADPVTGSATVRGSEAPDLEALSALKLIAFHNRQDPCVSWTVAHPLGAKDNGLAVAYWHDGYCVLRRLTPVENERLMGFPDDYTRIPWRGKPAENCPDGPRYKALGNSMAVNCMEWIGQRIKLVDSIL